MTEVLKTLGLVRSSLSVFSVKNDLSIDANVTKAVNKILYSIIAFD